MEPRGCNRWQSAANRLSAETAETRQTVAVGCDRLPEGAHGKEGVDGSSPSEGLKSLQIAHYRCPFRRERGDRYGGGHLMVRLQGFFAATGP